MQTVYKYINDNPSKFFFYSKLVQCSFIFVLFWVNIAPPDSHFLKMVVITFSVSFFATSFWGFVFFKKSFEKNTAKILLYMDLPLFFLLLYPYLSQSGLSLILPVLFLVTISILFGGKELYGFFIFFFGLFFVSSILFGLTGHIQKPIAATSSQSLVFILIALSGYATSNSLRGAKAERTRLVSLRKQMHDRNQELKQELLITKKRSEVLDKDVKKRDIEIQNILSLSDQLKSKTDDKDVLMSFLLTAIGQIGNEHALLLTASQKEQNFLNILLHKGLRTIDLKRVRFYLDSYLIEVLNSIREPVMVDQIPQDRLYDDEKSILNLFKDDLLCPVFIKKKLTALYIFGKKISGVPFSKDDINLISIIANQTSFVLEQTQASNEYRNFYSKTMKAMLNLLETKYSYARGHNVRTANYVNIVSKKLGFSDREVGDFSSGALLHDVGKVVVPDKYLLNSSKFSDENVILKEKILEHTLVGSKILQSAGFNDTIVDMALHHHEFYNGTGFPHKVGKDDISMSTKILSVCNAYDAMTSDRPYREALPDTVARENLRLSSGIQFDPEVVDVFLEQVENNQRMLRYHA